MSEHPDDADGDALRLLAQRGANMERPMLFEFAVAVANESDSDSVVERLLAANRGGSIEAVYDPGELEEGEEDSPEEQEEFGPSWTVLVTCSMKPTHANVVGFERSLAEACSGIGELDGWNVAIDG